MSIVSAKEEQSGENCRLTTKNPGYQLGYSKLPIVRKVYLFWEGHKILRNIHRSFDSYYRFAKFCGLLRIYELYYLYLLHNIKDT